MRRSILRAGRASGPSGAHRRSLSTEKPDAKQRWSDPARQPSPRSRFDRLIARTPRFLRPTVTGLRDAPVSHITAFLLLHEITAVVPLFGLAGAFHYGHWLPPYFAEGQWVVAGVEKFGRYFRKKGWISEEAEAKAEDYTKHGEARMVEETKASTWSTRGEEATRWLVEFATAWAVVKALMPLRIAVSVWGAPWFATWTVIPVRNALGGLVRRRAPPPS